MIRLLAAPYSYAADGVARPGRGFEMQSLQRVLACLDEPTALVTFFLVDWAARFSPATTDLTRLTNPWQRRTTAPVRIERNHDQDSDGSGLGAVTA